MNHTRKMVVLAFLVVLTQEMCYNSIGAVKNHPEHGEASSASKKSDVDWNKHLLRSLISVWMESDPATEGHAERMFQIWSSNPSQYPPIPKEKLYQTARQFIIDGKIPAHIETRGERGKTSPASIELEERIKWGNFREDASKFLAKLPEGKLTLGKPICDVFLEKHHEYLNLDRQSMSRYMYSQRSRTGQASGRLRGVLDSRTSRPPRQASVAQYSGASSSRLPLTDTHSRRYSNLHHSQTGYVDHTHSEMFSSMSQFSQQIHSHYSSDQLHQRDSGYYHGESSSQTPRFRVERPATTRLNHTFDEHERGKRSRTGSQSESSSSRRNDDNLDLNLHL